MTIAVEPKIICPEKGVVGIEDTYLTAPAGACRLTSLPPGDLASVSREERMEDKGESASECAHHKAF